MFWNIGGTIGGAYLAKLVYNWSVTRVYGIIMYIYIHTYMCHICMYISVYV